MDQKQQYQAEIKALLKDYETAISEIKARFPHEGEIANLEANAALLRNKLEALERAAGHEKWERLKQEINAYMGDIGKSLREGFSYYK